MITITQDNSTEMVDISKDGVSVFSGNFWDLPSTPLDISSLLEDLGLEVELKHADLENEED